MPNDTPVPTRRSWRSPAPPRGGSAGRDPVEVFDPGEVGFDAPNIAPPMLNGTPAPSAVHVAPTPAVLQSAPPAEDPRELARRLGQEAKARMQQQKPSGLAASAPPPRQAPAPAPAPAPPKVRAAPPPPSLDDPLDDDFDDPVPEPELPPLGDDEPLPPMRAHQPLSARPLPPPPKPVGKMSAADALKAAMAAEVAAAARPEPIRARPAEPEPAPKKPIKKAVASPSPAPGAARPSAPGSLESLVPGARFDAPVTVSRPEVFKALWRAHRARAQADADLALLATAAILLDAVERLPAGSLVAVRLEVGDEVWAAWFDGSRGLLLGAAQPADVYLAGL